MTGSRKATRGCRLRHERFMAVVVCHSRLALPYLPAPAFFFRCCAAVMGTLLFCVTAFSQSVSASADRDKILIGEQITIELKAQNINTGREPLLSWFALPDTVNHLEIVKRSPIDTIELNGLTTYIQNITVTSFDSGAWQLPPLRVVLQNARNDSLSTAPVAIEVLPVDVSSLREYHEMKDIIDVEVAPDYLLLAGIALTIAAIALAVWYIWFRNKKKPLPALKPAPARSLFETAIDQLERLQKENPPAPQFYNRLDDICRSYFQNQLFVRAMQLTGDELMVQLNLYLSPEVRTGFYQLLRLISAVKFARYLPGDERKRDDIRIAKSTLEHIYYHLQRSLIQHAQ